MLGDGSIRDFSKTANEFDEMRKAEDGDDGNDEIVKTDDSVSGTSAAARAFFDKLWEAVGEHIPHGENGPIANWDDLSGYIKRTDHTFTAGDRRNLLRAADGWRDGSVPNKDYLKLFLTAIYGKNWQKDAKALQLQTLCNDARTARSKCKVQKGKNHQEIQYRWDSETKYFPDGLARPNQNLIAELIIHTPENGARNQADILVTMSQSVEDTDHRGVIYDIFLGQSRLHVEFENCEFVPKSRLGDADNPRRTQVKLEAGSWRLPSQKIDSAPINGERLLALTCRQDGDISILTLKLICNKRHIEVERSMVSGTSDQQKVEKTVKDKIVKAFIQKKIGKSLGEGDMICIAVAELKRVVS